MQLYIEYLAPGCAQSEPQIITLHVGSNSIPVEELDWDTALRHLEELGRFAAERNGMVLLENLKVGWTTDPNTHLEMIQRAGLQGLTFDTGHAASNPKVRGGELRLVEYVDLLQGHIRHVHFYFYESLDKGSHVPPQRWDEVAEVWRKVVNLPHVQSVVLELSSQEELEQTFAAHGQQGEVVIMSKELNIREELDFYRRELLENILPFWIERALDRTTAGILPASTTGNGACQHRQVCVVPGPAGVGFCRTCGHAR